MPSAQGTCNYDSNFFLSVEDRLWDEIHEHGHSYLLYGAARSLGLGEGRRGRARSI